MVRVIKEGKLPNLIFRGSCRNCRSQLEEDRAKISITYGLREHEELGSVTCPVCGERTWLYPVGR